MSAARKAQDSPQHTAKPTVKFTVPTPLELNNRHQAEHPPRSGYYSPVRRSAGQKAQPPAKPESGALSHSRAGFAEEPRQERTYVRDWSGDDRKARSGKARTLREHKKRPSFGANQMKVVRKIPGIVLLSHSQIYSTIAAGALNYRVREGNVCFCSAMDTGNILQ